MRVGVDISPLVETRAGTARHVRGLVGALRERPGSSSSCSRSAARASFERRRATRSGTRRARTRRTRARRPPLHDFRGPVAPRVPTVVTCTTSRSFARRGVPALAPALWARRSCACPARSGRDRRGLRVHAAETIELRRRPGGADPRRPERRRRGLHARGRARTATTSSRSRRSSRGRTSARAVDAARRPASSCASSARAAGEASR